MVCWIPMSPPLSLSVLSKHELAVGHWNPVRRFTEHNAHYEAFRCPTSRRADDRQRDVATVIISKLLLICRKCYFISFWYFSLWIKRNPINPLLGLQNTSALLLFVAWFSKLLTEEVQQINRLFSVFSFILLRVVRKVTLSWFQIFAALWMLYAFFWVISRRLNFICRRFGKLSVPSS